MKEDPSKITYFAKTNSRGKETAFGIKRIDRARHMYIIGKTGMGKSTLLENLAIQDIRNGEGMAFIDPHGSTADRIMEYIPEHRIKDVLYFAPFDMEHPVAFNVMEDVGYDKRHLVVSGLMSAFKKLWVDAWSARMEYILSNTLLALLEYEGSTLLDVNTMFTNKAFRKKVAENVKDPIVRRFWLEEFAGYTDRFAAEATPAIQNKVGQFTSNPLIRNIIGQPKSSFDLRQMMDEKKIIIFNLSKGRVGEINTKLLGSMLVTKIYLAAMSRADVPASVLENLPSFYLYVDEFQNFANESFSDILSEARKYKLRLIIAHQYVEQMEEEVRDAVFGNVGTTISFRVGPFDAETLETIFTPQFLATDLVNLGFAQIYLTLMIDGVGSPPFSATTLAPFDKPPQSFVPQVIRSSRETFAKSRTDVEEAIKVWNEAGQPQTGSTKPPQVPQPPHEAPKEVRERPPKQAQPHAQVPQTEPRPPRAAPPRTDYQKRPSPPREEVQQVTSNELGTAPPRPMTPPVLIPKLESAQQEPRVVHNTPTTAPAEPRPKVKQEESRPPLEGSSSLRDALRAVTAKAQMPPPLAPLLAPKRAPEVVHVHSAPKLMPDLRATLEKIVASSGTSPQTPPLQAKTTQPSDDPALKQEAKQSAPLEASSSVQHDHEPAGLPEEVLRSMLSIDGLSPDTSK